MKRIRFNTPEGQFTIPLKLVAEHRANEYAKFPTEEWNNEVNYVMKDDFEGIDWLINNSDFGDWKKKATKQNSIAGVSEDDFWTCTDDFEIEEFECD